MDISLEKWLVMVLLVVISTLLGFVPYVLIRFTKSAIRTTSKKYQLFLTVLSCFGGGVLFSTAMIHVLPEVRERSLNVAELWETFDDHFPVTEMFVLCGFCLIYVVEEVAHFIMVEGHGGHHHHVPTVARHNSIAHGINLPVDCPSKPSCTPADDNSHLRVGHRHDIESSTSSSEFEECPDEKSNLTSRIRAIIALIALSFHAVVEGIAIGIQTSTSVWVMFGGIASHKFVISFCMGMELMTSQAKLWTYTASIVFFAVVSPVGIIIGSAIASSAESADTLTVVLVDGIVCGTLLYVVFFEIMNRERERKTSSLANSKAVGFIQFAAMAVGLVAMGALSTLTHEHAETEDAHDDHDH